MGIDLVVGPIEQAKDADCYGAFIQYPGSDGSIQDHSEIVDSIHEKKELQYSLRTY